MSSLGSIVNNLISGELIAYPTEGVWGLGCDPNNLDAVQRLLTLKERSPEKGLILLGSNFDHFTQYSHAAEYREKLMSKWPGPHTWLVPAKSDISYLIKGSNDKVALRLSDHKTVRDLCNKFGGAIISTSANKDGQPTLEQATDIKKAFSNVKILDGALGGLNKPSTIQDIVTDLIVR